MERDPFLPTIEKFLSETGLGAATLGRKALNDPNFVRECRLLGRKIGEKSKARLVKFMTAERRKLGKRAA
jgi:tRNA-dihydrouridine synthase